MFAEAKPVVNIFRNYRKSSSHSLNQLNKKFHIDWETASFSAISPESAKHKNYKGHLMFWTTNQEHSNYRANYSNHVDANILIGITEGKKLQWNGRTELYGYSGTYYNNTKNLKKY